MDPDAVLVANNWNPFSSKPSLDAPAFAISIAVIGLFEFAATFLLQDPIHSARLSMDLSQLALFYGVWLLVSVLGFWLVTNTFIKRWSTIFGDVASAPKWMRTIGRLLLTSPLLSIWATIFTLTYSRSGTLFRDGEKRSVIFATAAGTLVLFHVAFLGDRMVEGEIRMKHGFFELSREKAARESLRKVAPGAREEFWLPGPAFQIHVYPYFSPVSKLAVSLYGDFVRSRALEVAIEEKPEAYCDEVPAFVGVAVANCFLTKYREMGRLRAYVSPATGVIYETLYRRKLGSPSASTPIDAFAKSAIGVENLVSLLEPSEIVYDRTQFTHPRGFLAFFGSPELAAISFGQDAQHFALSKRLLPMIAPQMQKLESGLAQMKGSLSPSEEAAARAAMTSLGTRLRTLERDPLGLRGGSGAGERGTQDSDPAMSDRPTGRADAGAGASGEVGAHSQE